MQCRHVTPEEEVREAAHHRAPDLALRDACPIDVLPALGGVAYNPSFFQPTEERGDGGGGQVAGRAKRLGNLGDGGLPPVQSTRSSAIWRSVSWVASGMVLLSASSTRVILRL
jgi:hypothetical protein